VTFLLAFGGAEPHLAQNPKGQGHSAAQIARTLRTTDVSVRGMLRVPQRDGPIGVADAPPLSKRSKPRKYWTACKPQTAAFLCHLKGGKKPLTAPQSRIGIAPSIAWASRRIDAGPDVRALVSARIKSMT
jgi:hypothetical protein